MMKHIYRKAGFISIILSVLFLACGLISGTFVVTFMLVENDNLEWNGDFYFAEVDLTDEEDWQDHSDEIKRIDLVGFELWANNLTATDNSYSVYFTRMQTKLDGHSSRSDVENDAIPILQDMPLPVGASHISYAQSFKYLINTEVLKQAVRTGEFKLFAFPKTGGITDVHIDSLRVVVTVTAGK